MLCNAHAKEPRTLIVKEKGLAPVFLDLHLEHPAGWICARYKSSVLLLLLLLLHDLDLAYPQKQFCNIFNVLPSLKAK